jgi:hypothetical protein
LAARLIDEFLILLLKLNVLIEETIEEIGVEETSTGITGHDTIEETLEESQFIHEFISSTCQLIVIIEKDINLFILILNYLLCLLQLSRIILLPCELSLNQ